MKKTDWSRLTKHCVISFAAFSFFMILSCSNSEEKKTSDSIEKTTEKIAREAVDRIQEPIEKAKLAKELQESHDRDVQKAKEQIEL
ncbi:MAG TPA: hypothetical protein EYG88_06245 [Desulfocapsa sulfexigens]|nr:hypothetical protein [Desulfocapsa sulfexigens]